MDIGTTLRTARERRGMTLAQVAATTKIPIHNLRALEENAFEKVPRGIFVRGFLRSYAAEVGLEPHAVVEQFLAENAELAPAPADAPASDALPVDEQIHSSPIDPDLTPSGPGWGYALVVAALVIAVVTVNQRSTGPDQAAESAGPGTSAGSERAGDPAPVATAGQRQAAVVAAGTSGVSQLRFDMEAQGECWVEAVVDGRRVVYRLMRPGERATLESGGEIVLRVGDPGALTYSVNGTPGKPLGRAGIPVTVRFTNQGA
jgi:cytoskeletal protein RodZ